MPVAAAVLRPLAVAAALAAAAGAMAGCGDEGGGPVDPSASAQEVFAERCGRCHTLAAAGTDGRIGPDLDDLQPSREVVLGAIESGPGIMPSGLVEGAAAERVADYVARSSGG